MTFEKVEYIRLYEKVVEQIEAMIQRGELAPGDQLPAERDLSELFNVSRGTLREAFRVLEQQGIIYTRPGGGRYVAKVPAKGDLDKAAILASLENAAILDLLEAREVIELKVVELACQRATLEEIIAIEETFSAGNGQKPVASDYAFHLALADASHNQAFINLVKLNLDLLKKTREKTLKSPDRVQGMVGEHYRIFEAVRERDQVRARETMLAHLSGIRERMLGDRS